MLNIWWSENGEKFWGVIILLTLNFKIYNKYMCWLVFTIIVQSHLRSGTLTEELPRWDWSIPLFMGHCLINLCRGAQCPMGGLTNSYVVQTYIGKLAKHEPVRKPE